jgi:hypothetical protein
VPAKRLTQDNRTAPSELAYPHGCIVDEGLPRQISRPTLTIAMASLVGSENAVGRTEP